MSDPAIKRALDILGLQLGYKQEDVNAAFRKKVREIHPDKCGNRPDKYGNGSEDMSLVAAAKTTLLDALQNPNKESAEEAARACENTEHLVALVACFMPRCMISVKAVDMLAHLQEFHHLEPCDDTCMFGFELDDALEQHLLDEHSMGSCGFSHCRRWICFERLFDHLVGDHLFNIRDKDKDALADLSGNGWDLLESSRKWGYCHRCDLSFQEDRHADHFTKTHGWELCGACGEALDPDDQVEIDAHFDDHPACGVCRWIFKNQKAVNKHLVDEHKYEECPYCAPNHCVPRGELDAHTRSFHFVCDECEDRVDSRDLPSHRRNEHGWTPCRHCVELCDPSGEHNRLVHRYEEPPSQPQQQPPSQPQQQPEQAPSRPPSQQPPQPPQQPPPQPPPQPPQPLSRPPSQPRQQPEQAPSRPPSQQPPQPPQQRPQQRPQQPPQQPKRKANNGGCAGSAPAGKRRRVSPRRKSDPPRRGADNGVLGDLTDESHIPTIDHRNDETDESRPTIADHRENKEREHSFELRVEWKNGSESWEPESWIQQHWPRLVYSYWQRNGGRPAKDFFCVFKVLKRLEDGKYLVQWEGYSEAEGDTSEETHERLEDIAGEALKRFLAQESWLESGGSENDPIVLE